MNIDHINGPTQNLTENQKSVVGTAVNRWNYTFVAVTEKGTLIFTKDDLGNLRKIFAFDDIGTEVAMATFKEDDDIMFRAALAALETTI